LDDKITSVPDPEREDLDFQRPQEIKSKPAGEGPKPAAQVEEEPQYEDLEESEGSTEFDDFFS
jgi:hypothetical protein